MNVNDFTVLKILKFFMNLHVCDKTTTLLFTKCNALSTVMEKNTALIQNNYTISTYYSIRTCVKDKHILGFTQQLYLVISLLIVCCEFTIHKLFKVISIV